jgi:coenzyme F420-reducing hydrogenase delta subunit/ferredoxin
MVPSKGSKELAKKLGLDLDEHGFFEALDEKVALTRTSIPNIVLSGACHGPKDVPESVAQASAAAQEIASWLETAKTVKNLDIAMVNKDLCNACGLCLATCNYSALRYTEDEKCVFVDEIRCIGCGECFAICPVGAIAPLNTNREVIDATISGIVDNVIEKPSPIIIGFACKECSYRAIDEAGEKKLQSPSNLHIIEVPCAGGISTSQILRTLETGAIGVVLFACDTEVCHYGRGSGMATTRARVVRNLLSQSEALPEQVQVVNMIGRDAVEFADAANKSVDAILKVVKGG